MNTEEFIDAGEARRLIKDRLGIEISRSFLLNRVRAGTLSDCGMFGPSRLYRRSEIERLQPQRRGPRAKDHVSSGALRARAYRARKKEKKERQAL